MSKQCVTVLMGGPDAERDVSIASGTAVTEALKQTDLFEVSSIVIDTPTLHEIELIESDVIFPVLHGSFGEGGPLQELLEHAGKTFVGASSQVAKTAMDKEATKQIASRLGIQTPSWYRVQKNFSTSIDPPVVLKPNDDGSSIGIAICMNQKEVTDQLESLQHQELILAEKFIYGREVTVGFVCGKTLPLIEIIPPTDLKSYDFEAKYKRDDTQYIQEPKLPKNNCVDWTNLLCEEMGINDIARADFIINKQGTWFLEVNTMPGFTDYSLLPMAAKHVGIEMPELCTMLVHSASNT